MGRGNMFCQELGPESWWWVGGLWVVHKTTKQSSRQLSLILVDNTAQLVSWVHGSEGRHGRIFSVKMLRAVSYGPFRASRRSRILQRRT